jgi:hypothetical protein
VENQRFLWKLTRLRADCVDARAEARLAHEWGWVGYLNDTIVAIDREFRMDANRQAKAEAARAEQLQLVDDSTDQAS